jgi:methyl-accepting chemotaxis protein
MKDRARRSRATRVIETRGPEHDREALDGSAFRVDHPARVDVSTASAALALALGYAISWSLLGPVKEIETRLEEVAAGDFTRRVPGVMPLMVALLAAAILKEALTCKRCLAWH